MRKILFILIAVVCQSGALGADPGRIFFPDILPANSIACLVPPDADQLEQEYSGSLFRHLAAIPEMEAFFRSLEESRRELAEDLARAAQAPRQFASDLLEARLGLALINAGIGRGGEPALEFALVLALKGQADRAKVFAAVMSLLNRPEVVSRVLKSQGMDPNLPLKTLAQEETLSGYPPVLRIGPDLRVAALGNLVLIYGGQGSEGITRLFNAAARPETSLSRHPLFQAARRGSEATPGSSFIYVNAPRLMSILDVLNFNSVSRAVDALGLSRVQALGVSGSYHRDGVRHNLFIYSPGGRLDEGVFASLLPVPPEWKTGMEAFSRSVPASSGSFLALRANLPTLLRDLSAFLDAVSDFSMPGGLSGLVAGGRILGVPLLELAQPLGSQVVVHPHDDSQVVMFYNVNIPALEAVIARMEQNAGAHFSSLPAEGRTIRYFNRRASLKAPLAPAFCLAPRGNGQTGILYAATHPQTLVSFLQEALPPRGEAVREPLSATGDFQKTASGLPGNFSLYYYNGDRDSYRRVYNTLVLPLAALWAGAGSYPVDTGLLPVASVVARGMFGCGIGIRGAPDGLLIQAFSPVGANALPIILFDRLASNPLVLSHLYARLENLPGPPFGW